MPTDVTRMHCWNCKAEKVFFDGRCSQCGLGFLDWARAQRGGASALEVQPAPVRPAAPAGSPSKPTTPTPAVRPSPAVLPRGNPKVGVDYGKAIAAAATLRAAGADEHKPPTSRPAEPADTSYDALRAAGQAGFTVTDGCRLHLRLHDLEPCNISVPGICLAALLVTTPIYWVLSGGSPLETWGLEVVTLAGLGGFAWYQRNASVWDPYQCEFDLHAGRYTLRRHDPARPVAASGELGRFVRAVAWASPDQKECRVALNRTDGNLLDGLVLPATSQKDAQAKAAALARLLGVAYLDHTVWRIPAIDADRAGRPVDEGIRRLNWLRGYERAERFFHWWGPPPGT